MINLRQAAEVALEALEEAETQNDSIEKWDRHALAIEVLRQALSQDHGFDRTASHMAGEYVDTAQQEPIALKVYQGEICYLSQDDDQSFGMWCPVDSNTDLGLPNETIFYTAQQAPVARVNRDGFIVETGFGLLEGTLLYTAPPIREWVELTDAEIAQAVGSPIDEVYLSDFRKVEAKIKEKNT